MKICSFLSVISTSPPLTAGQMLGNKLLPRISYHSDIYHLKDLTVIGNTFLSSHPTEHTHTSRTDIKSIYALHVLLIPQEKEKTKHIYIN